MGDLCAAYPVCSVPGHDDRRVVRDGFTGTGSFRRQRYRCVNADDSADWHRFTLRVRRVSTDAHWCADCAQPVGEHAGPPIAVGYHYLAGVVAEALMSVAGGSSYRHASEGARAALTRYEGGGGEPSRHGQLAADWVEVFADVVAPPDGAPWPDVVLLDSTDFRVRTEAGPVRAFSLLCAYGYDLRPRRVGGDGAIAGHAAVNGRLLVAHRAEGKAARHWKKLLVSRPGAPQVVVADADAGIAGAVAAAWRTAPPVSVLCVWHAARTLGVAVASDINRVARTGRNPDASLPTTEQLSSLDGLDTLAADLAERFGSDEVFANGSPSLSLSWLGRNEPQMRTQAQLAGQVRVPLSVGPLEAHIKELRRKLEGRAHMLRNGPRTDRLLRLMVAGANNEADRRAWAWRIYEHLENQGGPAAGRQRSIAGDLFR